MVNNPLVSIIVPVYNVEPYIEQCCRSVFEQTYDNCEFIFVDDCGTDGSMEILYGLIEEYSHLKDRIRVIRHDGNKGLPTARKTGIEAARGGYVQFVDSDDYVERIMTEHLIGITVEYDADIVVFDYDRGDNISEVLNEACVQVLDGKQCMCMGLGANVMYIMFCNKMFRRSLIYDNQLYAPTKARCDEDGCVVYRALYLANKVVSTSMPLYHYRFVPNSMNNTLGRYIHNDAEPLLEVVRIIDSFLKIHRVSDQQMLNSLNLYKLSVLRLLALYAQPKSLEDNKDLFASVTYKFVWQNIRLKWPHALVFFVWRSHQAWLLNVLRYIRDKHWYKS